MQNHTYVKPVVGVLSPRPDILGAVLDALAQRFGPADCTSEWRAFDHTRYYENEMGAGLMRCFVSFAKLVPAEDAAEFKRFAMEVEARFSDEGRRIVNIDPGYVDSCKLVLISGKHGGHKIPVAPGVFADLLLWYDKGWKAMPWAFPDFRDGGHFPAFTKMRNLYKAQIRALSVP